MFENGLNAGGTVSVGSMQDKGKGQLVVLLRRQVELAAALAEMGERLNKRCDEITGPVPVNGKSVIGKTEENPALVAQVGRALHECFQQVDFIRQGVARLEEL
jgi:hypothetical protein